MVKVAPSVTRPSVSALGFRRVEFVRLIVGDQGTTAEVVGVTHRLPHTIRVPLRTAQALIDAGVPRYVEARRGNPVERNRSGMAR
jgi:hypothetical protein